MLPWRFRQGSAPKNGRTENPPPKSGAKIDKKLRLVFGEECQELQMIIKMDLRLKGLVFAANEVSFEKDGQVTFTPGSIARFDKERGGRDRPGITILRSSRARLILDRPITSPTELGDRKILAIELSGGLRVVLDKR
jgi:hypothetical protein